MYAKKIFGFEHFSSQTRDRHRKPWSTRKRQTSTGVFCLLFVGRLNSKNSQHLTQINNAHMLVKVFNNLWRTLTAKVTIL
jgi:hypothetical protein